MDLKQLTYFISIVDEGSISAAAKELHISQPPLSMQMKALENELGVRLFERGIRSITLTDAGRLLYQRSKTLIDMAAVTKSEIKDLGEGLRGTLRIGMVSSSIMEQTIQKLADFHERYPEIRFQMYEENTYQLLDAINTNQIDIAIVRAPFSENGLCVKKYKTEAFVAVGIDDGRKEIETPEEIVKHPLLIYRRWENMIRQVFDQRGLTLDILCVADNAGTILQMARAGMGLALVPESFVTGCDHLRSSYFSDASLKTQLVMVRKDGGYMSNIIKVFFEEFNDL